MRNLTAITAAGALALGAGLAAAPPAPAQQRAAHTRTVHLQDLGVRLGAVDASLAAHTGVDADNAALVLLAEPDTPAASWGLRRHDIITKIEGLESAGPEHVAGALRRGGTLRITVLRAGEAVELHAEAEETAGAWRFVAPMAPRFEERFGERFAAEMGAQMDAMRAQMEHIRAGAMADAKRHHARVMEEMRPFLDAIQEHAETFRNTLNDEIRDSLEPDLTNRIKDALSRVSLGDETLDTLLRSLDESVDAFIRSLGVNISDDVVSFSKRPDKFAAALASALTDALENAGVPADDRTRGAILDAAHSATAHLKDWSLELSESAREALRIMHQSIEALQPVKRRNLDSHAPTPAPPSAPPPPPAPRGPVA